MLFRSFEIESNVWVSFVFQRDSKAMQILTRANKSRIMFKGAILEFLDFNLSKVTKPQDRWDLQCQTLQKRTKRNLSK